MIVAAAGLICFDRPAAGDAVRETFDKRLTADIKRVEQTPDTSDDAELAAAMLIMARGETANMQQLALLCDSIYKLGAKSPEGYPAAIEALELLADKIPERRTKCLEKILVLQMELYNAAGRKDRVPVGEDTVHILLKLSDIRTRSGDTFSARLFLRQARRIAKAIRTGIIARVKEKEKTLPARIRAGLKLQKQLATLKANPNNLELRSKLIQRLAAREEDFVIAKSLLTPDVDEQLQSYVPLALRDPKSLPADVAYEMAQWLRLLLSDAPSETRAAGLMRLRQYLNVYLMKHTENDTQRLEVAREFHDIELQLVKLGRLPGGKHWSLDVITLGLIADGKINASIEKARKYLWSLQRHDGSWPTRLNDADQPAKHATAMITYALVQSGVHPSDKRLARTLKTIAATETNDTLSLALRCCLWNAVNQQQPGKYATELRADALKLVRANVDGGFGATCTPDSDARYSNARCTQYAILGAAMASQGGVEIPRRFWVRSMNWWRNSQNPNGGWGRTPVGRSRHNPTAGGAVSMLICLDQLNRSRQNAMSHDSLQNALEWLDKHLDDGKNRDPINYLYTVSRLGVACDTKKIGKINWFKWASNDLLKHQKSNGAWKPRKKSEHISTALGILTLSTARGGR